MRNYNEVSFEMVGTSCCCCTMDYFDAHYSCSDIGTKGQNAKAGMMVT